MLGRSTLIRNQKKSAFNMYLLLHNPERYADTVQNVLDCAGGCSREQATGGAPSRSRWPTSSADITERTKWEASRQLHPTCSKPVRSGDSAVRLAPRGCQYAELWWSRACAQDAPGEEGTLTSRTPAGIDYQKTAIEYATSSSTRAPSCRSSTCKPCYSKAPRSPLCGISRSSSA